MGFMIHTHKEGTMEGVYQHAQGLEKALVYSWIDQLEMLLNLKRGKRMVFKLAFTYRVQ